MSYQVNQRINPYPGQPSMGLNSAPLQNVDTERLKQGVNDTPVTKAKEHKDNPLLLLGSMIASFAGITWVQSKFDASCRGEYKTTTVGKIGDWGDKVGGNAVFQKGFFVKTGKKASSVKKFLTEKVINKSKILYALFNTHSVPTNKMALVQASGISAELAGAATNMFEKFTEKGQNLDKIKKLGFVKNGQADIAGYQEVIQNTHKHADLIADICRKQGLEAYHVAEKGGKIPWSKKIFGKEIYLSEKLPFTKDLFCKKHYFSEYTNKLDAAKGLANTAQKTALGKALPRQSLRVLEGITCANTGGGIFGVLMGSYFIADSIVRTIKAPKGEKGKTFAESMVYNASFYLTAPLAMHLMHGAGGLQYIGMSKEQVAAYRKNFEVFDAKAKANAYTNKAEWKSDKTLLKDALKGDTKILKTDKAGVKTLKFMKNLLYSPLKFAGRVVTVGLESIRPYISKDAGGMSKFFKNLPFKMKDIAGYPMRIGLFLFVIAPPLSKLAAKASHIVFGKPTKSVLDEEKSEAPEKAAVSASRAVETAETLKDADVHSAQFSQKPRVGEQLNYQVPSQTKHRPQPLLPPMQNEDVGNQVDSFDKGQNLVEKYKADSAGLATVPNPKGQNRRYIPSPKGVVLKDPSGELTPKAKKAIDKADVAEQRANKIIGVDE